MVSSNMSQPCSVCSITTSTMRTCGRCGVRAYCGVGCQKADWGRHKNICKKNKFKIVTLEGRGTAVVATEIIEAGAEVYEEEPVMIVSVPSSVEEARIRLREDYHEEWGNQSPETFRTKVCHVLVEKAVTTLGELEQRSYRAMFDKTDPKTDMGIFLTNALPLGSYNLMGVFPIINRINHSCLPNCHVHWDKDTRKAVVYVTSRLDVGSELTISYLDILTKTPGRRDRQSYLKHHFYFICSCVLCSLTGSQLEEDDKVRMEAKDSVSQLKESKSIETSISQLEKLYKCFSAVPYSPSTQWGFYASGFRLYSKSGSMEKAQACLDKALVLLEVCKGRSSEEFKLLEKESKVVLMMLIHYRDFVESCSPDGIEFKVFPF